METNRISPEQFAARKAKFENACNAMGFSTTEAENYHRSTAEHVSALVGLVVKRASAQAIYDVTTNRPTGIVGALTDKLARRHVLEAAAAALNEFMEWDISMACDLAESLLHDCNAHDEARALHEARTVMA